MSNKKRVFDEIFEDNDELQKALDYPPSKKRKTCPKLIEIESICKIIGQSSLPHRLNTPTSINKEIAEFARGEVQYCSNVRCKHSICVFDEDSTNTSNIRYKSCVSGLQIFCIDCMEFAIPAVEMSVHRKHSCGCWNGLHDKDTCCRRLQFIPDCFQCDACHQSMPKQCGCLPSNLYFKCYICDSKTCWECCNWANPKLFSKCASCCGNICTHCTAARATIEWGCRSVCINCYDDKAIECAQCNTSYPLLYKTNAILKANNCNAMMKKCHEKDCDVFVCCKCNGTHSYCVTHSCGRNGRCDAAFGTFCGQHLPPNFRNGRCWRKQEFEEQSAITYERALKILLNDAQCVDVYDFTHKRWRPAKYFRHWNNTQKIMISYTDGSQHMDAWRALAFPCVCILLSRS
eukprot:696813_1